MALLLQTSNPNDGLYAAVIVLGLFAFVVAMYYIKMRYNP